jgi:peptide/nickel transport system substrate-binding protein
VRIGIPYSVSTLDLTAPSSQGVFVDNLALETLMAIGPSNQLKPWLAQSVSQPNQTTYIYHLRQGVKFWNGATMTADDVAYSLNYERRAGSQYSADYSSVTSVTAVGKSKVVVKLMKPDPGWPFDSATATWVFQKKFQQDHAGTFGQPGTLVMGTGPWIPTSLDPTSSASLKANPHWWGGQVPIQHISEKFLSTESSEALAFRGHAIDVTGALIGDPQAFASTAATKLITNPSCGSSYFFSMNVKSAPWRDKHVRRAVAYAINRSGLVKANGGYASPVSVFIDPTVLRGNAPKAKADALLKSLPTYPFSLKKARQQMAKSAYPHGFSTTLIAWDAGNLPTLTQALAGELAKIGINAQVNVVSVGDYFNETLGAADQRPPVLWWGGCTNPTLSGMDAYLGSKNTAPYSYNLADYTPGAVDSLISAGETAINPAKRFAIYSQLLQRLGTDEPYVPLFISKAAIALSSKFQLKGGFNTFGFRTGRAWLLSLRRKG